MEELESKLAALPKQPGVYIFRGSGSEALYVGKARNLRSRVRSYFQDSRSDRRYFIELLAKELTDIENVVVANEKEAAILENQLIKELRPRHNFKLRDDKEYLSLRLDPRAEWPRLQAVRRPKKDRAWYFGPYHSSTDARKTLRLVNRHFKLRTCTDAEFKRRQRPCLQYQIKRCPGPCVLDVDPEHYRQQVRHVKLFLSGRHDTLVEELGETMRGHAESMNYERAAHVRDQMRSIERVRETQHVASSGGGDRDVLGLHREGESVELVVMQVRQGRINFIHTLPLERVAVPDDELLAQFLAQHYDQHHAPPEIILPMNIEAEEGLADLLTASAERRVRINVPQRGAKVALVKLAHQNAVQSYKERLASRDAASVRLTELQQLLSLPRIPRVIECVDISHHAGKDTVGAVVALEDGTPASSRTRTFKVKAANAGDDYGAMYEVLSRRFFRSTRGAEWALPDLLVVDGGKGQLNTALTALSDLQIEGLCVVALAKERQYLDKPDLVDRAYLPGRANPIELSRHTQPLRLLSLIRDEAHRVSNRFRVQLGRRRTFTNPLHNVAGVGPRTRQKLLSSLGSLRAIEQASIEELRAAGITDAQARAVAQALGKQAPSEGDVEQRAVEHAFEDDESTDSEPRG